MTKRLALAALCCVLWAVTCYAQSTAIRPDQISPATPDITWAPGAGGYQIGTTVPWRTDATASPTFSGTGTPNDNAKIIELTFNGPITATLPAATSVNGWADGSGFTVQVASGTLTLNCTSCTAGSPPPANSINGKTSITVGAYQQAALLSRGGYWYAVLSVPQPAAQAGSTQLADNMKWVAGTGGAAPTGNCTASTSFFSRVWAAGQTLDGTVGASVGTGTLHLGAYDALICNLNTDGVWSKLDLLYIFATSSQTTALLNLVSGTVGSPATIHGSPVFTADQGFTGVNGAGPPYLDSGFNLATATNFTFNAAHISEWSLTGVQAPASAGTVVGAYDGTNWVGMTPWHSGGNANLPIINTAASPMNIAPSPGATGHYVANRSGSGTAVQAYRNGVAVSVTSSAGTQSSAVPANTVYVLALNSSGTASNGTANQVAAISVGGSLTAGLVSTGSPPSSGLYGRLCTYLTAVGARTGTC